MGGLNTVYAESAAVRAEWKAKIEEATGLRKVVQESNKVFEIETLSTDTFLVPSMVAGANAPSWNHENSFTGKVTCSVPFGMFVPYLSSISLTSFVVQLLQMGELLLLSGVRKVFGLVFGMIQDVSHTMEVKHQFGLTEEPSAMRRVLHLKMVTQCAMLEDFGIFLVLADKVFTWTAFNWLCCSPRCSPCLPIT